MREAARSEWHPPSQAARKRACAGSAFGRVSAEPQSRPSGKPHPEGFARKMLGRQARDEGRIGHTKPKSATPQMGIFRANAAHGGLLQRFLNFLILFAQWLIRLPPQPAPTRRAASTAGCRCPRARTIRSPTASISSRPAAAAARRWRRPSSTLARQPIMSIAPHCRPRRRMLWPNWEGWGCTTCPKSSRVSSVPSPGTCAKPR